MVEPPLTVRVAFAHAALQHVADRHGVDVLHIKGPALDPQIVRPGRTSTDADIVVRPSHLRHFITALREAGWVQQEHFRSASSFEHSAAFRHPEWGLADVHRLIPGFTVPREQAFDRLWTDRHDATIAGRACPVPSLPAQVLIIALHAARSPGSGRADSDVEHSWGAADNDLRDEVKGLVTALGAEVPFSVVTGTLDEHRDDPQYLIWKVASRGGTRLEEWRARIKAARTPAAKTVLVLRAPLVNVDHLRMVRGRPVTWWEIVVEFFARPARGLGEWWKAQRS
ncbi:nucleotidyltransferase family protein [Kribbia dieselivorans]|uniref:nucleotidyltransferase family protein n=1 Tax=Kribbia dieselivorans TaxID=331526 RepID=UPI001C3F27FE|nr:nucleotidyltransferase family protein [Kribbia dieselivorans]